MTPESVLAKTPKGSEEIEHRTHRLGSRLRQALIRIDGAKTLDEHLELAGDQADTLFTQFEELERDGFVVDTTPVEIEPTQPLPEPVAAPAAPPKPAAKPAWPPAPAQAAAPTPAPAPPPAPAPRPDTDLDFSQPESAEVSFDSPVKFRLGDLLVDAIGVETGKLGTALQSCRNREDLGKWVAYAFPRIQEIAGKDKAKTFYKSAKQLVG